MARHPLQAMKRVLLLFFACWLGATNSRFMRVSPIVMPHSKRTPKGISEVGG
jgi:hypothetical protein